MRILTTVPILSVLMVLMACQDNPAITADRQGLAPSQPRFATFPAFAPYRYACFGNIAPDQAAANDELRRSYNRWDSVRVTSAGAGGFLRVDAGPNYGSGSVSEGMGYGMLLAAYLGDKRVFDGLWGYVQAHLNTNGLMGWHVDASGNFVDDGAATDGDEDIAMALLVANVRWDEYYNDFATYVDRIMAHEVEAGTYVVKPGDGWGGSAVTELSYFAPAYYRDFAMYRGDNRWNNVVESSYRVIANVNARGLNAQTGLLPSWAAASGDTAEAKKGNYQYGYGAARIPWRLGADAAWNCEPRAQSQLSKLNSFFRALGPNGIYDGYTLQGTRTGQWPNIVVFVGPAAAGSITSSDAAYQRAMWDKTVGLRTDEYYKSELRLLSLMLASGNMHRPLDSRVRPWWFDDFELGVARWGTWRGPNSTITRSLVRPAAFGAGMRVDYRRGDYCGVGTSFSQNWSRYRALEFWFKGGGTGNTIWLGLMDTPAAGSTGDTSERFEYTFVDDFTGWKHISLPLDTNTWRRESWQPAGAPNDGLTLTDVRGLNIAPLSGQGSFTIDGIALRPRFEAW